MSILTSQPDLSVIVPFYNEEDNIQRMHAAIVAAVEPLGVPFEMVFVDDGSQDGTVTRAIDIARSDPRVRIVKFRRTYGQTPAMAAGIEQARGKVLVTMDGDLQKTRRAQRISATSARAVSRAPWAAGQATPAGAPKLRNLEDER
jgi:glycosyltransferase involved in cell wall biosynthesis